MWGPVAPRRSFSVSDLAMEVCNRLNIDGYWEKTKLRKMLLNKREYIFRWLVRSSVT